MKGAFFQKPLEFALTVKGESWNQDAAVEGSLTVRNHGGTDISSQGAVVLLAQIDRKKTVRVIARMPFHPASLVPAGGSAPFDWHFQLDLNSPITDSNSSLFLIYGFEGDTHSMGHLQLPVLPHPLIQEFLGTLETEFRFSVKSKKSVKGRTEVKLAPPDSKSFALVDSLILSFKLEANFLELEYLFQVRRLDATATTFGATKQNKAVTQKLFRGDQIRESGRLDQEKVEKLIREATALVESKIF